MARPVGLLACVLAVVLTAEACAGRESPSRQAESPPGFETEMEAASTQDSMGTEQASPPAPASTGLAILDETIPASGLHGDYWPKHDDLRWISCNSDVAFIGHVTGYSEGLLTTPRYSARRHTVYDGLVFTVDEVLVGDLGGDTDQATVGIMALITNRDGFPVSRVVGAPFGVIRPGIEQRNDPDGPRYLVYAVAAEEDSPFHLPGVLYFNTNAGVVPLLADGALGAGADRPFSRGHGLRIDDARAEAQVAKRLCVKPPLPPGTLDTWRNSTGLSLNMGEALWVDRLDRVCKAALGPDIDSPVWDHEAALALAEDFADEDGLRADLPPESHQQFLHAAAGALWIMIVQRAGPDAPSVCWDRVPAEFLETGPPGGGWGLPPGFDTHMTEETLAALRRQADRMLWLVVSPLPSGTREIWWDATGLRATILEHKWIDRLNRACNTPMEDPVWDRDAALVLAEDFILEDGGEPSPELVEAGADALWRMTTEPLSGACPWHYPADTLEPELFEQMKEIRRAALNQ